MVQRRFKGVRQAPFDARLGNEPVNNDIDIMFFVLIEGDIFRQFVLNAIDHDAGKALFAQIEQLLAIFPLSAADHGREQLELRPFRERHHLINHLRNGLGSDLLAALVTVWLADPGKKEAKIIVDLGDRADGGAGIFAGRLLLDGDGRGQPFDRLHIRLVHLLQELAGIGGKRLHVAALPLGIDGVEGQGRLAGTGNTGDDHQLIAGNFQSMHLRLCSQAPLMIILS